MEPKRSLPHSHVTVACPYPQPARSSPYSPPTSHFLKIHLNIILPSKAGSFKWPLSLSFPHQNPAYASPLPIRATWPAQLILDLITRTILGEKYRPLGSSLCSFLLSPVTSSLLGYGMLLHSNMLSVATGDNVRRIWSKPTCFGSYAGFSCSI